jgi:hypothetical protein
VQNRGLVHPADDQRSEQLAAVLETMGEWLSGIVAQLSRTSGWTRATTQQRSELLRETVIGLIGRAPNSADARNADDEILAAYFKKGRGTWDALLTAIVATHPPRAGADHD